MKKLTKTTALILSALMLFGCTSNSANGGVGDTTPPSESSVTERSGISGYNRPDRRAKVRSRTAKTKVRLKARLLKTAQLRIIQMIKAMKILLKISMGIRRFRMIKTSM